LMSRAASRMMNLSSRVTREPAAAAATVGEARGQLQVAAAVYCDVVVSVLQVPAPPASDTMRRMSHVCTRHQGLACKVLAGHVVIKCFSIKLYPHPVLVTMLCHIVLLQTPLQPAGSPGLQEPQLHCTSWKHVFALTPAFVPHCPAAGAGSSQHARRASRASTSLCQLNTCSCSSYTLTPAFVPHCPAAGAGSSQQARQHLKGLNLLDSTASYALAPVFLTSP
jgi:hypothetical protein